MNWSNMEFKKNFAGLNFLGKNGLQWTILFLVGLLMMVIALPVKEKNEEAIIKTVEHEVEKTELEDRLEKILSSVEGIGKVQVMLMVQENNQDMFSDKKYVEVTGALISAQGAEDMVTVQNIKQAVIALFQLDAHKIKVMKMNEGDVL